ncbi:hypothetical protein F5Y15DRAFT_366421 [Xylariaceae sp. FL0016]|nr:hypothetical protein F5Y15DRAFT_366421 [Xylariaceae sp. FL0016]
MIFKIAGGSTVMHISILLACTFLDDLDPHLDNLGGQTPVREASTKTPRITASVWHDEPRDMIPGIELWRKGS